MGCSSMAERPAVNREVGGSSPPAPVCKTRRVAALSLLQGVQVAVDAGGVEHAIRHDWRCGNPAERVLPIDVTQNHVVGGLDVWIGIERESSIELLEAGKLCRRSQQIST